MTPSDLKHAALRKLKVISASESATPEDFGLMGEKYTGLHAMLLRKSLVTWALAEDIPAEVEQPLIMMLAAFAADDFGVPEPRATILKSEGGLNLPAASPAERLLRAVTAPSRVSGPVRAEYF